MTTYGAISEDEMISSAIYIFSVVKTKQNKTVHMMGLLYVKIYAPLKRETIN